MEDFVAKDEGAGEEIEISDGGEALDMDGQEDDQEDEIQGEEEEAMAKYGDEMGAAKERGEEERRAGEDVDGESALDRKLRKRAEVFVGGLDPWASEEDIRTVFDKVGEISEIRLIQNPATGRNKGYCFVRYATVAGAKAALTELAKVDVLNRTVGVLPCEDNHTVFLGNIGKSWTKEQVKEALEKSVIENLDELTLMKDAQNEGMNRGFAFLEFPTRKDAARALKRLQKGDIMMGGDRPVKAAFAQPLNEPDEDIMSQVKSVFVNGMPPLWPEERVREFFSQWGEVDKVVVAGNLTSAKRKDFGFVNYVHRESALKCIEAINGKEIGDEGKKMKVEAMLARPAVRTKGSSRMSSGRPGRGGRSGRGRGFGRSGGGGGGGGGGRGSRYGRARGSRGRGGGRGGGGGGAVEEESSMAEFVRVITEKASQDEGEGKVSGIKVKSEGDADGDGDTKPAVAGAGGAAAAAGGVGGDKDKVDRARENPLECSKCSFEADSSGELARHRSSRVHRLVERLRKSDKAVTSKTPLSLLHEYAARVNAEVSFATKAIEGDAATGTSFEITASLGGPPANVPVTKGQGKGKAKAKAKQMAAADALEKIMERLSHQDMKSLETDFVKPRASRPRGNGGLEDGLSSGYGRWGPNFGGMVGGRSGGVAATAAAVVTRGGGYGRYDSRAGGMSDSYGDLDPYSAGGRGRGGGDWGQMRGPSAGGGVSGGTIGGYAYAGAVGGRGRGGELMGVRGERTRYDDFTDGRGDGYEMTQIGYGDGTQAMRGGRGVQASRAGTTMMPSVATGYGGRGVASVSGRGVGRGIDDGYGGAGRYEATTTYERGAYQARMGERGGVTYAQNAVVGTGYGGSVAREFVTDDGRGASNMAGAKRPYMMMDDGMHMEQSVRMRPRMEQQIDHNGITTMTPLGGGGGGSMTQYNSGSGGMYADDVSMRPAAAGGQVMHAGHMGGGGYSQNTAGNQAVAPTQTTAHYGVPNTGQVGMGGGGSMGGGGMGAVSGVSGGGMGGMGGGNAMGGGGMGMGGGGMSSGGMGGGSMGGGISSGMTGMGGGSMNAGGMGAGGMGQGGMGTGSMGAGGMGGGGMGSGSMGGGGMGSGSMGGGGMGSGSMGGGGMGSGSMGGGGMGSGMGGGGMGSGMGGGGGMGSGMGGGNMGSGMGGGNMGSGMGGGNMGSGGMGGSMGGGGGMVSGTMGGGMSGGGGMGGGMGGGVGQAGGLGSQQAVTQSAAQPYSIYEERAVTQSYGHGHQMGMSSGAGTGAVTSNQGVHYTTDQGYGGAGGGYGVGGASAMRETMHGGAGVSTSYQVTTPSGALPSYGSQGVQQQAGGATPTAVHYQSQMTGTGTGGYY